MKKRFGLRALRAAVAAELALLLLLGAAYGEKKDASAAEGREEAAAEAITWVDFNVSYEALCKAYEYDVGTYGQPVHLDWIELLAYAAAAEGGEFGGGALGTLDEIAGQLSAAETTMEEAAAKLEYYPYYHEAYEAVLAEYVGEYEIEDGQGGYSRHYGLKAFLPVAYGFPFTEYDDFGASRSYGYQRKHLGHDMMGQIGSPIIAVESGTVEALGWNQYGGWRIGIRSHDKKRYYYYAHLRQNYPYREGLEEGSQVTAGEVIGYMGHTGYSATENVNNIESVHLHFGIELIFDEKRREEGDEIWIDCYQLCRFLYRNRSVVRKIEGTKEWERVAEIREP